MEFILKKEKEVEDLNLIYGELYKIINTKYSEVFMRHGDGKIIINYNIPSRYFSQYAYVGGAEITINTTKISCGVRQLYGIPSDRLCTKFKDVYKRPILNLVLDILYEMEKIDLSFHFPFRSKSGQFIMSNNITGGSYKLFWNDITKIKHTSCISYNPNSENTIENRIYTFEDMMKYRDKLNEEYDRERQDTKESVTSSTE